MLELEFSYEEYNFTNPHKYLYLLYLYIRQSILFLPPYMGWLLYDINFLYNLYLKHLEEI